MTHFRPTTFIAIAALVIGCAPRDEHPGGDGVTISEQGGRAVFDVDGQRVVIDVPPGAVEQPTTFSASLSQVTAPGILGPVFELGPSGLRFERPVIVYLPSPDDGAGAVLLKHRLVTKPSGGAWERLSPKTSPPDMVAGVAMHFSLFGVVADPESIGRIGPETGTEFDAGSVTLTTSRTVDVRSMTVAEGGLQFLLRSAEC